MADTDQVLLLRHGQTDWNVEGRLQGRTDVPLNETGTADAHQVARVLAGSPLARIASSPLARALRTAQIVAEALGIEVREEPRLIERDFGRLEGELHSDILLREGLDSNFAVSDRLPADAESWLQVKARMRAAHDDLLSSGEPVLIVSHVAALTALAESLGRKPPVFLNCTPVMLHALPKLAAEPLRGVGGVPDAGVR